MSSQPGVLERTTTVRTALRTADSLSRTSTADPSEVVDAVAALCQQKLNASHYADLRQVVCHFHEGMLTMRGTVSTYYMKQLAYAAVRDVPGAESIVDRIEVAQPKSPSGISQPANKGLI